MISRHLLLVGHRPDYIQLDINQIMRPVRFLSDSLKCLRDFPQGARHDAGYQIDKVQRGSQPDDFKPMPSIGKGVEEIAFRTQVAPSA